MTFEKQVATVLRNLAVIGKIQFYLSPMTICYSEFQGVADAIESKKIAVVCTPSKTATFSFYDATINTMVLRTKDTHSVKPRSLIVHEAVHAMNDINRQQGLIKDDDEAAAYLAQGMYLAR